MAILTALSDDDIREACGAFGVSVASASGVLAGSVNTNYDVAGAGGARYFLRLYEEQDDAGARRETVLVETLARLGVPTPAPLPRRDGGGFTVVLRGKAAALYPFVAGTIRCQRSVAADDVREVGRSLARVHLAGLDPRAEGLAGPTRFGPDAIRSRLDGLVARDLPDDVRAASTRLLGTLEEVAIPPASCPELPLIHGDLFRDNVLFHERGLALLDFESASTGLASFDVAVTTLAWCFGDTLDPRLTNALLAGYTSVRPLDRPELDDLPRAARLACVRFATTRITDYELRPRGLGVYKDFRRWIARLDAVEAAAGRAGGLFSG